MVAEDAGYRSGGLATHPTVWSEARWARILDRMEFRQPGVGLRFFGPPLWLEVTMSGPDSDLWPLTGGPDREWNWQSAETCDEATDLAGAGADDDEILASISRYTIANLILNGVHEIGEWLRLDGRRVYPAHGSTASAHPSAGQDLDGNGAVSLVMSFAPPDGGGPPLVPSPPLDEAALALVGATLAPSRFTYLPRISVSYKPQGPVVTRAGEAPDAWRSTWSAEMRADLDDGRREESAASIRRDVHRAVVEYEADRACRAFCVDLRPAWAITKDGDLGRVDLTLAYAPDDPAPSAHAEDPNLSPSLWT